MSRTILTPPSSDGAAVAAVVLDFDGTVTRHDIGDMVCGHFADAAWQEIDRRWVRGELSLPEAQRQMWALCRCEPDEAAAYALEVGALRPGLDELIAAARRAGVQVWLASGGFDFYIEPLLGAARLGLLGARFYNRARFAGGRVQVEFPHVQAGLGCERCAVCKGRVCAAARRALGGPVAFIGDGYSDRCVFDHAAGHAGEEAGGAVERIFAVAGGALGELAAERGIPAVLFSDFAEVTRALFPLTA